MNDAITVLLVDDDDGVVSLTATYLEEVADAIETVTETSAADGLERVESGEIDCVVSDFDMPGTNGLEFLEAVREVESALPFILFTGKGSEEIASEAISAGVTDYLQKETGTEQYEVLANRIENLVAQYRAQEEATEATRQIRRMFKRITDAFFSLDDDWEITYVNQQAAEFAGATQDDLIGKHVTDVMSEQRSRQFFDAYRRALEEQEPVTFESESSTQPGAWVEERVYPSEDGISVYFRDITDRKQVEMELRETKAKIEELHDIAARAEECSTEEEVFDLTIEAAEEILEFDICGVDSVEDGLLVPRAMSSGTPPEGYYEGTPVDAEDNLAARTYRTGESYLVADLADEDVDPAETAYRSAISVPFGESGVFQAVAKEAGRFDEDDLELAELLITHLSDALQRVRTERELRAERDRFAALFENVPNPVVNYVYRGDEPIVQNVNAAFERVFGWSAETVAGCSLDDFILPEEMVEEAAQINERIRNGQRVEGEELRRKTKEEGVKDFLFHTVPVQVEDEIEGFSVYTDITEQKGRERELQRQNERLDEFASVISHDLRNPLNVLRGRVDLMKAEQESEHLDSMERSVERMDDLIGDVLALAQKGRVVNETETVSLSAVATDAWATTDSTAAELDLADDLGTVDADRGRLRELLENLFRNAVEHAWPEVTVTLDRTDHGFYVADDGPGVPEADRERLFEHGYTTSDGGTGLGLSIVQSIAEAHGWEIEVGESASGGARFDVTI
jgi:PAS domain S-box-containing protein